MTMVTHGCLASAMPRDRMEGACSATPITMMVTEAAVARAATMTAPPVV